MTTDYPGQVAPSRDNETTTPHRATHCPTCQQPFTATGRQAYFTNACRQIAYRRRHRKDRPDQPAAPAGRSLREHTIYLCQQCDTATSPPSGAPTATGPATDSDPAATAAPAANCSASTSSSQAISCHDPHVDHRHVRSYADRHARLYADTRPVGARRGGVSDWFLRPGSAGQRDEPVGALGGFKRSPGLARSDSQPGQCPASSACRCGKDCAGPGGGQRRATFCPERGQLARLLTRSCSSRSVSESPPHTP